MRISALGALVVGLSGFTPAFSQDLPAALQGLGLRESKLASRDMPGWRKPEKIVVHNLFGVDVVKPLRAAAPAVEIISAANIEEVLIEITDADAFIGTCEHSVLSAGTELRWVQTYFAGVESCTGQPLFAEPTTLLSNGQRLSSTAIGDHSIALMMSLVRGLDVFHSLQASGTWNREAVPRIYQFGEVSGKTLLVVGLGGIGTQVAKRAHGLGMRVLATRSSRREGPEFVEYVGLAHEAVELAAKADVVINAAPLTENTRHMFNVKFFAAMKPSAYFISVGRGESTVTDDLLAALKTGQIAGAGLDVTDPEPLPPEHELWTTPRVIITPHMAAMSPQSLQRIFALVGENLRRYVAGEPMLSVVNIKKGY